MKTETFHIINGEIQGPDTLIIESKADYDSQVNGLVDYVADKELAVEFNHKAFSEIYGEHYALFYSDAFKSLTMDNCIAWEEDGIITICFLDKEERPNIGSSFNERKNH